MASIMNYLKGHFLMSKNNFLTSIEYSSDLCCFANDLLNFSFDFNSKSLDRNTFLIDFSIEKNNKINDYKTDIYKILTIHKNPETNTFAIFVRKNFTKSSYNNFILEKNGLKNFCEILIEYGNKIKGKPAVCYITGLEILECYFQSNEIIDFLKQISTKMEFFRQIIIFSKINLLSENIISVIRKITVSTIIIENEEESLEIFLYKAKVYLLISKKNGYCSKDIFLLFSDQKNKSIYFNKYEENKKIDENKNEDLQKYFNTTFNLNISESQKKSKDQLILPYMKAINQKELQPKTDLIQLENEDIDEEDDDEDDIDV